MLIWRACLGEFGSWRVIPLDKGIVILLRVPSVHFLWCKRPITGLKLAAPILGRGFVIYAQRPRLWPGALFYAYAVLVVDRFVCWGSGQVYPADAFEGDAFEGVAQV